MTSRNGTCQHHNLYLMASWGTLGGLLWNGGGRREGVWKPCVEGWSSAIDSSLSVSVGGRCRRGGGRRGRSEGWASCLPALAASGLR